MSVVTAAKTRYPASRLTEQAQGVVATVSRASVEGSRRESDDNYRAVICHLDSNRRVIECRDSIQWVVQNRYGGRWRNGSFHLDRDVMIKQSGASGAALAILQALPARRP